MACIITYEKKQYTQKEFEQYFKEHFTEFVNNFLGSKEDIEGFKKFIYDQKNSYKNNIYLSEEQSQSSLKKEIGITAGKEVSNDQIINIKKKISKANDKNFINGIDEIYLIDTVQVGQANLYNYTLRKVAGKLDIKSKKERMDIRGKGLSYERQLQLLKRLEPTTIFELTGGKMITSSTAVLTNLAKTSKLAQKILDNQEDEILVKIISKDEIEQIALLWKGTIPEGGIGGLYVPAEETIYINEESKTPRKTVLHEVIHAQSVKALEENPAYREQIEEYIEYVKTELSKRGEKTDVYGLKNPREFMAELFSNQSFIRILESMPAIGRQYKNLWTEIFDYILKTLGITRKNKTLYENAFALGTQILEADSKGRAISKDLFGGMYQTKAAEQSPDEKLDSKLIQLLSKYGIKVETYEDLKSELGVDAIGAADFLNKIIKISKGKQGIDTLPEEAAHFFIRMITDTPLYNRLYKLAQQTEEYNTVVGEYGELYANNKEKLVEETMGKILAKYLIKEFSIPKEYNGLRDVLNRIWNYIKKTFGVISQEDLQKEIENAYGKFASSILKEDVVFNMENLKERDVFYKKDQGETTELTRIEKIINKAIKALYKRMKFLEARTDISEDKKAEMNKLLRNMRNKKAAIGIINFIHFMEDELQGKYRKDEKGNYITDLNGNKIREIKGLNETRKDLIQDYKNNSQSRKTAKDLRDLKSSYDTYMPLLEELERETMTLSDISNSDKSALLTKIRGLIQSFKNIENTYYELGKPLFGKFLKVYMGNDKIIVPFGDQKDREIDIMEMLEFQDRDISWMHRWLDAMAESSDDVLKLIDIAVKDIKEGVRISVLDDEKDMIAALKKLEASGVKNTDWIYERDAKGNLTGYIISKYNRAEFEKKRLEEKARIIEEIRKNNKGVDLPKDEELLISEIHNNVVLQKQWDKAWALWLQDNMQEKPEARATAKEWYAKSQDESLTEDERNYYRDLFNKNVGYSEYNEDWYFKYDLAEPDDKYINKSFGKGWNKDQHDFYALIMKIKEKADKLIPQRYIKDLYYAPQMHKDVIERIKTAKSLKEVSDIVTESTKDTFKRREDEVGFGGSNVMTDASEQPINTLPIYFVNPLSNKNDLSTDIVSVMNSYNYMAQDYGAMDKVIDILELGKDIIGKRQVGEVDIEGVPKQNILNILGKVFSNRIKKEGKETHIYGRLSDYYDMIIYGKLKKDEKTLFGTKLDRAKTLDAFGKYVAINNLAFNFYAGIQNPIMGGAMMRIEAMAGEYVDNKDLFYATKIYTKYLPENLSQLGQRNPTNKLALWNEYMDTLQEAGKTEKDFKRRTIIGQALKSSSLFFINHAGEHWMQTRMSLALANREKLKNSVGKEINLWDAVEVVDNKLKLKKGVTKLDGSEYTLEDLNKFKRKQNFVNKRLHGIYNIADRAAMQKYALGRLGIMFRKFIKPGINRRFEKLKYNYEGQVWTEGYYNTTWRFMRNLSKELFHLKTELPKIWKELHAIEKANLTRSLTDVIYMITAMTLATILTNLAGDDDDWALNMLAYQVRRLQTELMFYVPIPGLGLNETLQIIKSPAAAVSTLDQIDNLLDITKVFKQFDTIEKGKYKGWTRGMKNIVAITPTADTWMDLLSPEDKLIYFMQ